LGIFIDKAFKLEILLFNDPSNLDTLPCVNKSKSMDLRCPICRAIAVPPTRKKDFENSLMSGKSIICSGLRSSLCMLGKIGLEEIDSAGMIIYPGPGYLSEKNVGHIMNPHYIKQTLELWHISIIQNGLDHSFDRQIDLCFELDVPKQGRVVEDKMLERR